MKNIIKKIAVAVVLLAAVTYAIVFNIVREKSVNEAIPAVNTVYYGGDYFIAGENVTPETANTQSAYASNETTNITSIGFTLVNINTAGAEELMKLSGIGEVTANAIIEYRNTNGEFRAIDDIKNVKGIGEAKFETIKAFITVGETAGDLAETAVTTTDLTSEIADSTSLLTYSTSAATALINLNTASHDELMTISGVGEATAAKIIAYRDTYGFKDVSDLLLIDGIGEAKYNAIVPFVTI
jgi:comEA protein